MSCTIIVSHLYQGRIGMCFVLGNVRKITKNMIQINMVENQLNSNTQR